VKRRYFLVCDSCDAAVPVDAKSVSFERHPIAFMDRFGVVILLGVCSPCWLLLSRWRLGSIKPKSSKLSKTSTVKRSLGPEAPGAAR